MDDDINADTLLSVDGVSIDMLKSSVHEALITTDARQDIADLVDHSHVGERRRKKSLWQTLRDSCSGWICVFLVGL